MTAQNLLLCSLKNALHKPTSDGHDITKAFWETNHAEPMTLEDAVELCRKCHRMAPFCLYNGNTFTAVIRDVVTRLGGSPSETQIVRSLAGHIVAGVASDEETAAFRDFCRSLDENPG